MMIAVPDCRTGSSDPRCGPCGYRIHNECSYAQLSPPAAVLPVRSEVGAIFLSSEPFISFGDIKLPNRLCTNAHRCNCDDLGWVLFLHHLCPLFYCTLWLQWRYSYRRVGFRIEKVPTTEWRFMNHCYVVGVLSLECPVDLCMSTRLCSLLKLIFLAAAQGYRCAVL